MTQSGSADVLVASNRGPVAFTLTDDGRLELDRGGGGLVSGLSAVGRGTRAARRIGHSSHPPWAPLDYFRLLPDEIARGVLCGVLGVDHAGVLSPRWAEAFMECCAAVLGARVDMDARTVDVDGRVTRV